MASTGLFALTAAWFIGELTPDRRRAWPVRLVVWTIVAATLFEVGYPSSPDLGSSEAQQKAFYEALFGLLDGRRDDFGFIGIYGLGDRAIADCEREASWFGALSEPEELAARASARCSMGLRAERPETEKPAWQDVAAALSRYR